MQPEAPVLIWDADERQVGLLEFVAGRSWDDYQQDVMLRSAQIDDALVWEVASTRVPELTAVLAGLLDDS